MAQHQSQHSLFSMPWSNKWQWTGKATLSSFKGSENQTDQIGVKSVRAGSARSANESETRHVSSKTRLRVMTSCERTTDALIGSTSPAACHWKAF